MISGGKPPSLEALMARFGSDPAISSIGSNNVSLAAALDRCRSAEAALDSARENARAAARREGKGTGALFAKSKYILRESGTKWADEARHEGFDAGFEMACKHFGRALRPQAEKAKDPFHNLARGMVGKGPRVDRTDPPVSEVDRIQAAILKSREIDLSSNALIDAPVEHGALAEAIHEAAAKARTPTGQHSDDAAPMNALSAEILKQGRRRRGEEQ